MKPSYGIVSFNLSIFRFKKTLRGVFLSRKKKRHENTSRIYELIKNQKAALKRHEKGTWAGEDRKHSKILRFKFL
jgi:lipopolysaccharide export LptBFGC system permease protein LptF